MTGYFLRVSPGELRTYMRNSWLLQERVEARPEDDPALVSVDKAWEGIFYLLTGASVADEPKDPLARILVSDQLIDAELDMGYGPAYYITDEQVIRINKTLSAIDRDELADRYDPDAMNEQAIYPEGWDDGPMLDFVLDNFDILRDFFKIAAAHSEAVISYIA